MTVQSNTIPRPRIKGTRLGYPAELKAHALAQVAEGRTIAGTARDLGIAESTLGAWCTNARKAGKLPQVSTNAHELAEAQAMLARVVRERDALKAALGAVTAALGC